MRLLSGSLLIALFFAASSQAQVPNIKINGESGETVFLQKLDVDVKITGSVARTTWTMTFKNTSNRLLEGELNFPLPQGTSVSSYALDINGHMREAVPVEKEKATMVFENTERRRIDPGILEKVDGNLFRTRIYPITGNGTRTVRIGYEEELRWERQSDLRYHLPLAFQRELEAFSIHISVLGRASKPRFEESEGLEFGEWQNSWTASKSWKNYQADKSIEVRIPQQSGLGSILMQQSGNHYFYAINVFPQQQKIEKPAPHHITLLWDASLSGLKRDHKKELALLEAYFSKLRQVEVSLVRFSNTVQEAKQFAVKDGQWSALEKELQATVYDGGTQFGVLDLRKYVCDEFLLFSDGHSNYGSNQVQLGGRPVYAIAASAGTDYPFLESIANRSGGVLINLDAGSVGAGRDQLLYQTLQFMGVKPSEGLEESYPSTPTPVSGSFMVTGICYQPEKGIELCFGYGGKVVNEMAIKLDYDKSKTIDVDLERLWAQKKIAELDTRYEDNKLEIQHLGKRYGIVTRNTSLMVLENVGDYVMYEIEPPAELREEYDRLLKGRVQNQWVVRQQVKDNAEMYFNELLRWWSGEWEKAPVKKREVTESARTLQVPDLSSDPDGSHGLMRDVVVSASPKTVARGYATYNAAKMSDDKEVEEKKGKKFGEERGTFTSLKAEVNTGYLTKLKAASPAERYSVYLQLRQEQMTTPLFYFHVADFFFSQGEKTMGIKILSNVAELEAENYELDKLLAYKLKELGEAEAELAAFRKVVEWRPFEPQSYRDYGLALADAGYYQQALDTLYFALTRNYDANVSALYPGIEETLVPEINQLIASQQGKIDVSRIPRSLVASMPVDIRVVLNWNRPNTDIDLWVTDPDNERCFYGHRFTGMGGRISQDFTRGLGPEQFLLKKARKGKYKVQVNYYGDTQVKLAGETSLMVEVYTHYGTPQQQRRIITLQMKRGSSGAIYVGDFDF
ncbi:MAG: DUF2135 domain-containing protein [Bacteroidetes bacterium]|nr:DUF2135 domain-containing protein [Bacteroidota bacterium]